MRQCTWNIPPDVNTSGLTCVSPVRRVRSAMDAAGDILLHQCSQFTTLPTNTRQCVWKVKPASNVHLHYAPKPGEFGKQQKHHVIQMLVNYNVKGLPKSSRGPSRRGNTSIVCVQPGVEMLDAASLEVRALPLAGSRLAAKSMTPAAQAAGMQKISKLLEE